MSSTLEKMKLAKRWLLHRNKKPFYAATLLPRGQTDTDLDQQQLVTYEDAQVFLQRYQLNEGIKGLNLGFALGPDGNGFWQGIDLDNIDDNELIELVNDLPGYVEFSPSGRGVHAIGYGPYFTSRSKHDRGVEFYCKGRFFTFTGQTLRDAELTDLSEFIDQRLATESPLGDITAYTQYEVGSIVVAPEVYDDLRNALKVIPANQYVIWHQVLQALKRLADSKKAFKLAMDWSMSSRNPDHNFDVFIRKWNNDLDAPGSLTYKTIFKLADEFDHKWRDQIGSERVWQEVDLGNLELEPIDYLIDDFLARSVMVVVGKHGVGKSTAMMALCAAVVGIHIPNSPLRAPARGRKVIYVSEDISQFKRNMIAFHKNFNVGLKELSQSIVLVLARRVPVKSLLTLKDKVIQHTTYTDQGVLMRPWIVFDTTSATIDIADENSNAEVSKVMAELKHELYEQLDCSVCLVSHSSKSIESNLFTPDARGASAWAADATLTAGIFEKNGFRYFALGKRRYSPTHTALKITHTSSHASVLDTHGRQQTQNLDAVCLDWEDGLDLGKSARGQVNDPDWQRKVLQLIHQRTLLGYTCSLNGLTSVRKEVGLSKEKLRSVLNILMDADLIHKTQGTFGTGSGWDYMLTDAGVKALHHTYT